MKKNILKSLMLPCLILILITGCGEKENHLEIVKTNMQALKSYTMNVEMILGMKIGGVSIELPINMNSAVDNENDKTKTTISMDFMGTKKETVTYIDSKDENSIIRYSSSDNINWEKSITTNTNNMTTNMINDTDLVEVKSDDKDYYLYEAKLSKGEMSNLIKTDASDYFAKNNASVNISFNNDITFKYYVNKQTHYVEKILADLTDVANIVDETSNQELELTKLYFEITYSDFNGVEKIVIPNEALNVKENNTMNCVYNISKSGINMDSSYIVNYEDDYVISIKSIEKFTSDDLTALDLLKKQIEEKYLPYKNLEYYDYNIEIEGNTVISTVNIDYSKIDTDKMIEIDASNSQVIKDGKIRLSTIEKMYKSIGVNCTK